MKVRRRARIIALQTLFEVDSARHDPETVLSQRLQEKPLPERGSDFAHSLVQGVIEHMASLNDIIQRIAPQWPLEQIAIIDRNILRIAIFEMAIDGKTPVKVAINEAVELAKLFGSDSSPRFVNGVLGTVVSQRGLLSKGGSKPH